MKEKTIGNVLKEERIRSGMSVEQVSDLLINKGHKATPSSVYNWENDISQPKPGVLLDMCRAYGIKDVLHTFGYVNEKEDDFSFSTKEQKLIEKYRALDTYGTRAVDTVMDVEYDRCLTSADSAHDQILRFRLLPNYQRVSAGRGQFLPDSLPDDYIEIPDIPDYRHADFVLVVDGDSMEPDLYDGDIILVESTPALRIGEIGVFCLDGESFVKELGRDELISRNPQYPPLPFNETIRCLGRVIDKL